MFLKYELTQEVTNCTQPVPEINISRTTTLEFQDFSRVFQDLCLLTGLSRLGDLNVLIPGLSKICTNPEHHPMKQ